MFPGSNQNALEKFNIFSRKEDIKRFRLKANKTYIAECEKSKEPKKCYLSAEEEFLIVRYYERELRDFFFRFKPKREILPKDVRGAAYHFFKRFYVISSVMDFHPKEMMLTCVFLSCKVCEYYVPINVFVRNIDGDPAVIKDIIFYQESELLNRINFKINIYTPNQAVDGYMFEIKERIKLQHPERVYEQISRFLSNMWYTDVCMLYTPPQIALAAILHAFSRCKEHNEKFLQNILLFNQSEKNKTFIVNCVREIRTAVVNVKELPPKEYISQLENKLAVCRNPHNNPANKECREAMKECFTDVNKNIPKINSKE